MYTHIYIPEKGGTKASSQRNADAVFFVYAAEALETESEPVTCIGGFEMEQSKRKTFITASCTQI